MNAYATKRAEDMPMLATVVRERKYRYRVVIKFAKSRRIYSDELVFATTVKHAKQHILKMYPTVKFKKG
jgi:hypothetical protein